MRKPFHILFVSLLIVAWFSVSAQVETQSTGPIPYMKVEYTHNIVNTLDNPASIAFAHNSQGGATLSMPIPAGTPFTTLSTWTPPGGTFASSMQKGGTTT